MSGKDGRILVVDDFLMIRDVLKSILSKAGFKNIDEASTGEEALELIDKAATDNQPYSLVFLDWSMPGMDGIDLLKICRSRGELKDMPIVMVTAESTQEQILQALSEGANDYILKPFSPDRIQKKLEHILGEKKVG